MNRFFGGCACLLAMVPFPVAAQTGEPAVVVVQAFNVGVGTFRILVSRGAGHTEVVDTKLSNKTPAAEAEACQQVVATLYREGYTLKGALGRGYQTNLIFVKGP